MKKFFIAGLAFFTAFTLSIPASHAGPWTLKQNKIWTEVYTKYFFSKEHFNYKGNRSRWGDGGFSQIWDIEGKLEYGITDDLNFLFSVPYTWSRWQNDWSNTVHGKKEKHEGFKQVSLGAKYKFLEKPVVLAIQPKVFIHIQGTDKVQAPDLYEYGDAFELRGLIGKSFNIRKRACYVAFEAGYRWESSWWNKSDFANWMPVFGEAGFAPFDWLMLKGELDFRLSHKGTGIRKDTLTWRAGPIISLLGNGFSSIRKGGESSLNLELQYGQTIWGRGDGRSERYNCVSAAQEFIAKVQVLF